MADPSPDEPPEGQEPEDREGQEPDGADEPDADEQHGRSYSESYVRQLRREAAGLRKSLGEVEERLQAREDADKTDQEKLAERAEAAEARAKEAELRLMRFEVAAERGLDPAAVQFLTGSTKEELELRAEELAKLLQDKGKPTAGGFDGGARKPAPEKGTPEEEHNRLLLEALGRTRPRAS